MIFHVTSHWTGFIGSPGFTNHYFAAPVPEGAEAETVAEAVHVLWEEMKLLLPTDVTITIDREVEVIDEATGLLVDSFTTSARASSVGQMAGPYSAPTGFVLNFKTSSIYRGHRVRGRTFIVPAAGGAFANDGTIDVGYVPGLNVNANAFATSDGFGIWCRPDPSKTPAAGAFFVATSGSVPDKAVVLRSRRD